MFELLLFLLFVGLPALFIYGIYFIGKKLQSRRLGLTLAAFFSFGYAFLWFYLLNEDLFFTKSDAREILAKKKIFLTEEFEINKNQSASGIGDYYHTFTLKISAKDNEKLSCYLRKKIDSNAAVLQKYPKSEKRFYRIEDDLVQMIPTNDADDSEEVRLDSKNRMLTYTLNVE